MRLRVGVGILAFVCAAITNVANADPYTFFQPYNGANLIASEHFASPYLACVGAEGNPWSNQRRVEHATYDPVTQGCTFTLDNNNLAVGTINTGSGSCPGTETFNFSQQICGDGTPDTLEQWSQNIYATNLAMFLWMCIGLGLLVGFKASQ